MKFKTLLIFKMWPMKCDGLKHVFFFFPLLLKFHLNENLPFLYRFSLWLLIAKSKKTRKFIF